MVIIIKKIYDLFVNSHKEFIKCCEPLRSSTETQNASSGHVCMCVCACMCVYVCGGGSVCICVRMKESKRERKIEGAGTGREKLKAAVGKEAYKNLTKRYRLSSTCPIINNKA
jgi:hypothetical protein